MKYCGLTPGGSGNRVEESMMKTGVEATKIKQMACALPRGHGCEVYAKFNWISEERVALAEYRSYIYGFIPYVVHK